MAREVEKGERKGGVHQVGNRDSDRGTGGGGMGEDPLAGTGWKLPGEGVVKVNTDAGVVAGLGISLGAVARDSSGQLQWAVAFQMGADRSPKMAEAEAVLMGLKEAKRAGYARIIMESDCLNVITDLREKKTGRTDIFRVYDYIFSLCNSFISVVFSYVRRESNSVAHNVAHSVPWEYGRRAWIEDVPRNVLDAISSDLNGMN
ncbi:uncharacterized protein LOC141629347 [Silene latifolia]|uniref:uncharacterized protein LOC141629347 n=1 Tax=Silene latifolia TaxID=37657 RepID=UPI003D76AF45